MIRKAIESGDYFLACFSDAYVKREKTYMNSELNRKSRSIFPNRSLDAPVLLDYTPPIRRRCSGRVERHTVLP